MPSKQDALKRIANAHSHWKLEFAPFERGRKLRLEDDISAMLSEAYDAGRASAVTIASGKVVNDAYPHGRYLTRDEIVEALATSPVDAEVKP
jgi:hypothetical protein